MSYLLSIVVPTKNRYKYLKSLIKLIDNFNSDEIELVVHDNSDNNEEIIEYLKSFKNDNIKYYYTSDKLSQSGNSDRAILNSTGEYICYIGDDDGVTRFIIDAVKYMKNNSISVLMSNVASYFWPDYNPGSKLSYSGKLTYKRFSNIKTILSTEVVLNEIINRGFIDRGNMPLVYHGIVKRDVLDKIYDIDKTFFPGPSPDIANAVSISLIEKSFVYIDFPLIISGASKHHGGGIASMKNRAALIEEVPYLPKNAKENWEKVIPLIWTGETVWCESAIKALRYMKRDDLIGKVNFEFMYANFIAFHYPLRKMAYSLSNNKFKLFFSSWSIIFFRYIFAAQRLILLRFGKLELSKVTINHINNIIEAENHFADFKSEF